MPTTTLLQNPIAPSESERVYCHYITLRNRQTGDEQGFHVTTLSDRFSDVIREVAFQKVDRGLLGYEIFEVLDFNLPF